MKKLVFIISLFLTAIICESQVPSVGGMQIPRVAGEPGFNCVAIVDLSYIQDLPIILYEANGTGVSFNDDGTVMIIVGFSGDELNEFSLSTPYDLSSATQIQAEPIGSYESTSQDLYISPDGTKLYIIGTGGDEVNEFTLSTPWDVSSATHIQAKSINSWETLSTGLAFKSDGTKMFICGTQGDDVTEFTLSVAWDISTINHVTEFSVFAECTGIESMNFCADGTKFVTLDLSDRIIDEWTLETPWDISSAGWTDSNNNFTVTQSAHNGVFVNADATKFYIIGRTDKVWEFNL